MNATTKRVEVLEALRTALDAQPPEIDHVP